MSRSRDNSGTGELFAEIPVAAPTVTGGAETEDRGANTVFELHLGDCVEGMAKLPADSVDVVVTSPPYNLGIRYRSHDDTAPREEYLAWSERWTAEVRRVLKPTGSFFLNIGAAPANPWLPHELVLRLRSQFILQNTLHWIKSITVKPRDGDEISVGHFKPLQGARYVNDCHEYIFHLTKNDGGVALNRTAIGVEYADKSNIARWGHTGGKDRRCRGNTWFIPYKTIKDRNAQRPHPATFPAQLANWCIRLHGVQPGLTVMDPFFGLGHAGEGARAAGATRCIGFELDEYYLSEAKKRLGIP